ncbi:MAG: DUF4097 family beta strand repeat-containing protein [Clostridia bacterium]|nr:DUF4097 family beta strand repeat-containing protein [Clostridia bacterium]
MPQNSKSGLKVFIFLLIAIIGSIILGIGAFLILSPGSEIFGISYNCNIDKTTVSKLQVYGTEVDINISQYNKVVIETKDAKVKVARGYDNAAVTNFEIDKSSYGFYYVGDKVDYTYNIYSSGDTLFFKLNEPEYSFLKLRAQTELILNINANQQLQENLSFDIITQNGGIEIGGATSLTEATTYPINLNNISIQTESGVITFNDTAFVKNDIDLENSSGTVLFKSELNSNNVNIKSNNVNVNSNDLNVINLNIESTKSDIKIGNVSGNVYLDVTAGIFNFKQIYGNFISSEKIDSARILIEKVDGNVQICNNQGRFTVDIKDANGEINILTDAGNVKIGNIRKQATIETRTANVDVTVAQNNKNRVMVETKNGSVKADFKSILEGHEITTERGRIEMRCSIQCAFYLNANSDNGYINTVWKGERTKGKKIINSSIGSENPNSMNKLTLFSNYGDIIMDRYGGD